MFFDISIAIECDENLSVHLRVNYRTGVDESSTLINAVASTNGEMAGLRTLGPNLTHVGSNPTYCSMKAYKLEVLVIDLDKIGEQQIKSAIENTHYPNHCISPEVIAVHERDIGEWSDDHPLNSYATRNAEIKLLFYNHCKDNEVEKITITKKRYLTLLESEKLLSHLEANGVDNWEGYSHPDDDNEEEN